MIDNRGRGLVVVRKQRRNLLNQQPAELEHHRTRFNQRHFAVGLRRKDGNVEMPNQEDHVAFR